MFRAMLRNSSVYWSFRTSAARVMPAHQCRLGCVWAAECLCCPNPRPVRGSAPQTARSSDPLVCSAVARCSLSVRRTSVVIDPSLRRGTTSAEAARSADEERAGARDSAAVAEDDGPPGRVAVRGQVEDEGYGHPQTLDPPLRDAVPATVH